MNRACGSLAWTISQTIISCYIFLLLEPRVPSHCLRLFRTIRVKMHGYVCMVL